MSQSSGCAATQEIVPHRMLSVPDILHEIFEQIAVLECDGGRSKSSKTLFSLALCCRWISEIALDSLWRRMYTIMPLLELVLAMHYVEGAMVSSGYIADQSYHRYRSYSRRVEELSFSLSDHRDSYGHRLHPSVYVRLAQLEKPFLPALRRLDCVIDTPFTSQIQILPFFSPTICVFSLRSAENGEYEDRYTEVTLDLLRRESPRLRDLSLCIPVPSYAISSLASFTQLHSLTFTLSDTRPSSVRDIIGRLSILDNLVTLDITLPGSSTMPTSTQRNDIVVGLPSLERLTIKCQIPQITELLDLLVRGHLKSVTIHGIPGTRRAEQFTLEKMINRGREYINKIVSHFSQSLRDFTLRWQVDNPERSSMARQSWLGASYMLEPLLTVRQLRNLDCNQFPRLALSDNDIENMAIAWPEISELHLPFSTGSIQPTISSLRSLARHSSGLKHLSLTVNTRDLTADVSALQISYHGLSRLTLGHSLIGDPIIVARHLDRLFPSLEFLSCVGGDEDGWEQVYRMIRDLSQPARRDEKKRICSSA